ncbi:hypothetical protein NUW54_g11445 [Trametes sanguinea]|uniref:Uncharacterized protein n=1 Tax=Trametes sanguinea TaxID=158606 RepID=A0ACC1NFN2_9APHY|nr:hypothetical protein NUW54_g11445 [Trametes sanguinea]
MANDVAKHGGPGTEVRSEVLLAFSWPQLASIQNTMTIRRDSGARSSWASHTWATIDLELGSGKLGSDSLVARSVRLATTKTSESGLRRHHVTGALRCKYVKPPPHAVQQLLSEGIIPVVRFDGRALQVVPAGQTPYVAISHVWLEGMGSTTEDGLPSCVVQRIAGLAKRILPNHGGAFWMDSLCVPQEGSLRKRAIKSIMAETSSVPSGVDATPRPRTKPTSLIERLRAQESQGGAGCAPGPTAQELLAWLRNSDERWARVGLWSVEEALEWGRKEGRVWCVGKGRWEVCG